MKITIEPTEKIASFRPGYDTVSIKTGFDDVDDGEMIDVIFRLLIAWGKDPFQLSDYFSENCDIATLYFPEEDKNTASDIDE